MHQQTASFNRINQERSGTFWAWTDEAILEISKTDHVAFGCLVERNRKRFREYFRSRMANHDVDDALAELWEAAYRSRHDFDASRGKAVAWLYGIARNVVHHAWRGVRRHRDLADRLESRTVGAAYEPDPAEQIATSALTSTVLAAVCALPAGERRALELVVLQGRSYESAAAELDIPIGTIRSRLARARASLRRLEPTIDG